MSQNYSEAIAMGLDASYTPCATFLREKICDIITLIQFEQGNILTKTRNDTESGDKSNDN